MKKDANMIFPWFTSTGRMNPGLATYPAQMCLRLTAVRRWWRGEALTGCVEHTATSAVGGWWHEATSLWNSALSAEPFYGWYDGTGRQQAGDCGGRLLQVARTTAETVARHHLNGVLDPWSALEPVPAAYTEELTDWIRLQNQPDELLKHELAAVRRAAHLNGVEYAGKFFPTEWALLRYRVGGPMWNILRDFRNPDTGIWRDSATDPDCVWISGRYTAKVLLVERQVVLGEAPFSEGFYRDNPVEGWTMLKAGTPAEVSRW
jgi:hypothetical protein